MKDCGIVVLLMLCFATSVTDGLRLRATAGTSASASSSTATATGSQHKVLYQKAQQEEGMPVTDEEPYFLKWPRSSVEKSEPLNRTKIHKFNFLGKLKSHSGTVWLNEAKVRKWVPEFAQKFFGDKDYYLASTAMDHPGYVPLGKWDHSAEPQEPKAPTLFDEQYMTVLSQSEFTLCPVGDKPWTYRAGEAALAGSICIVKNPKDFGFMELREDTEKINNPPWHFYVMDDIMKDPSKLVYREDWVADNKANFIKYHTYIQGDNYPEGARKDFLPQAEQQARSVFERLDKDGDGKLNKAELSQAEEEAEQPTSVLKSLWEGLEKSQDGKVTKMDLMQRTDKWHKKRKPKL